MHIHNSRGHCIAVLRIGNLHMPSVENKISKYERANCRHTHHRHTHHRHTYDRHTSYRYTHHRHANHRHAIPRDVCHRHE